MVATRSSTSSKRTWDELDDPLLRHLRFDEVLERVATTGDLLAPLAPAVADPLTAYVGKRAADATPEPFPTSAARVAATGASGAALRFVIQEHHARRLHFDLRLERDGVLESWAVPRGIPETTDRNHLAVMTEPHPIEYLTFAGEIPAGQYGAGSMTVWDTGTYEAEKWREDEIIFTLTGRPGGPLGVVRLALIRTSGAGEKSQWLLHRMAPRPAAAASPVASSPAEGSPATVRPRGATAADDAPMLAVNATPARARAAAARRCEAWVEFKWDGIRAIGTWDGRRLRLRARSGTDITARYPELTAVDAGLGAAPRHPSPRSHRRSRPGRPSFSRLQSRMHLTTPREIERESRRVPVTYILFDVLRAADADVAARPLRERRGILEEIAADAVPAIVLPPVAADVDAALQTARELDLEGIVVKDPDAPYRRGARSEEWLKVKLTRTQDVVIGGIRPGKGGRTGAIGSLLLGIPEAGELRYVGRVGSGFSERELTRLADVLTPLRTDENPFTGVPAADASDALWVRPQRVAEVEFAEFTPGGTLRHARWRGLRPDVAPDAVRREV